jgi:hypothetical protein
MRVMPERCGLRTSRPGQGTQLPGSLFGLAFVLLRVPRWGFIVAIAFFIRQAEHNSGSEKDGGKDQNYGESKFGIRMWPVCK